MKRIEEIDKNFKVETKIQKNDIKFYNAFAAPFKLYGAFYENGRLRRMPETVARSVSEGVYSYFIPVAYGMAWLTASPEWPNGHPFSLSTSLLISWTMGAVITYIAYRRGKWRKQAQYAAGLHHSED